MRIKPASDDLPERVAIALNMVPLPAAYALYGMTAGRVLGVAQRLGVFARLLAGPATAGRVAEELELQVPGTRLLCENLSGLGVLEQDGHTFSLPKSSRKWLDPASDTYIGTFLEHTTTYWAGSRPSCASATRRSRPRSWTSRAARGWGARSSPTRA